MLKNNSGIYLKEENLHNVLTNLGYIENRTNFFINSPLRTQIAYIAGRKKITFYEKSILKRISRFFYNKKLIKIGLYKIHANHVLITNNILAFYPKQQLVCKFSRETGTRDKNNLITEVETIEMANKLSFFQTPKIIKNEIYNAQLPSVWYEMLLPDFSLKSNKQKEKAAIKMLSGLLPWYEYHGVIYKEPYSLFSENRKPWSTNTLNTLGWNAEDHEILLNAVNKIIMTSYNMPYSLIHGDASIRNCMIVNGNVTIFDWEKSKYGFIVRDIYKLLQQPNYKELLTIYSNWNSKNGNNKTIPPDVQNYILTIHSNYNLVKRRKYYEERFDKNTCEKKLNIKKQLVLDASKNINELLSI